MDKSDQQRRRCFLRKQLFGATTIQYSKYNHNRKGSVTAKWIEYINLNFTLQKPGPVQAVQELKQMIMDSHTPYYESKIRKSKRCRCQPFLPRKLNNIELTTLKNIMSIYETKLCDLQDTNLTAVETHFFVLQDGQ